MCRDGFVVQHVMFISGLPTLFAQIACMMIYYDDDDELMMYNKSIQQTEQVEFEPKQAGLFV